MRAMETTAAASLDTGNEQGYFTVDARSEDGDHQNTDLQRHTITPRYEMATVGMENRRDFDWRQQLVPGGRFYPI